LSADYSQIELRIMASMSGDLPMMQAFTEGYDIHAATAARVYGIAPQEVDEHLRRKAKTVNFGIIYGISAFGLSQRLGIARQEAANLINQYFDGMRNYSPEVTIGRQLDTLEMQHRMIVLALRARDVEAARQALRLHFSPLPTA